MEGEVQQGRYVANGTAQRVGARELTFLAISLRASSINAPPLPSSLISASLIPSVKTGGGTTLAFFSFLPPFFFLPLGSGGGRGVVWNLT